MADDEFPSFIVRMIRIVENVRERISEHRQAFIERDAVVLDVLLCFFSIPFEFGVHGSALSLARTGKLFLCEPVSARLATTQLVRKVREARKVRGVLWVREVRGVGGFYRLAEFA